MPASLLLLAMVALLLWHRWLRKCNPIPIQLQFRSLRLLAFCQAEPHPCLLSSDVFAQQQPAPAPVFHCAGLLWGWIVAGVAFIPYALWVLATANFVRAVGMGLLALAGTLGPLVLVDRFFYDKWTVRVGKDAGSWGGGSQGVRIPKGGGRAREEGQKLF